VSSTDAADERLELTVEGPAPRVAARLRAYLEARGLRLLPPRSEVPPEAFAIELIALDRRRTRLVVDPPGASPAELPAVLSQELLTRVTAVVASGEVCAYEAHERGRRVEKLAARGAEILDGEGSPHAHEVAAGRSLLELLVSLELAGGAPPGSRSQLLRFCPTRRRPAGETIEVDPLVTCPRCDAPTQRMEGRFGAFHGCVRFPECRGRRTEAEARRLREGGR